MREWIVYEGSSSTSLRPICNTLDAAPDTPVIRAARNACDRSLSFLVDAEQFKTDVVSECGAGSGDYACAARALRRFRGALVDLRRASITYARDIEAAMEEGACRNVLRPPEELEKIDRDIERFDSAVEEFERGDREALQALDDAEDDDIDDPAPCRPTTSSSGSTKQQIRATLDRFALASREKDYQALCNDQLSGSLVERLRTTGQSCEATWRIGLGDVQNPTLDVHSVEIDGDEATARVETAAAGQPRLTTRILLVREDDNWRISALPEEQQPTTAP